MAKAALGIEEPLGVISHLHACMEKVLKGIAEENNIEPPRIHSLKRLAVDTCKIQLESYREDLLTTLDKAFIDSRYPEDVVQFEAEYDMENCERLYKEVEGAFKWLKSLLEKN